MFLHNLKRGLRNCIYWLPIIWRDYHWDYFSLLEILKHKLDAIRMSAINWGGVDDEKIVEDIEHAISLIDAINNEEYEKHAFDTHERRWGRPEVVFRPFGGKFTEMLFVYPEASTQAEAEEQLGVMLREAMSKRQRAIDTLFGIIKDNFETWWD